MLLSNGLREAKMFEGQQKDDKENTEKEQKRVQMFDETKLDATKITHKDTSLISIDEFEDNCIIEDDNSSLSQLESKAFEIKSKLYDF